MLNWTTALWLVAVVGMVLGGAVIVDLEEREKFSRLVASNLHAASEQLSLNAEAAVAPCRVLMHGGDDITALADAFLAVESLSTGIVERKVEGWLVRLGHLTGLASPDFSIGPGQVRLSTAAAALHWGTAHNWPVSPLSKRELSEQLLSVCGSRLMIRLILEMLIQKDEKSTTPLDRRSIASLARLYNGQATTSGDEGTVANHIYRELIYHVFQDLRFRRRKAHIFGAKQADRS